MARYRATVTTDWSPRQTFNYMADFANSAEWDPGVVSAEKLTDDPLRVGARFDLVAAFLGREIDLTYETIELEAPRRVVLRAKSGTVVSLDAMTFEPTASDGTAVTYDADLRLKGAFRVADPLLRLAFRRIGDRARDGIAARLAEPAPTAPSLAEGHQNGQPQSDAMIGDEAASNGSPGSEAHTR